MNLSFTLPASYSTTKNSCLVLSAPRTSQRGRVIISTCVRSGLPVFMYVFYLFFCRVKSEKERASFFLSFYFAAHAHGPPYPPHFVSWYHAIVWNQNTRGTESSCSSGEEKIGLKRIDWSPCCPFSFRQFKIHEVSPFFVLSTVYCFFDCLFTRPIYWHGGYLLLQRYAAICSQQNAAAVNRTKEIGKWGRCDWLSSAPSLSVLCTCFLDGMVMVMRLLFTINKNSTKKNWDAILFSFLLIQCKHSAFFLLLFCLHACWYSSFPIDRFLFPGRNLGVHEVIHVSILICFRASSDSSPFRGRGVGGTRKKVESESGQGTVDKLKGASTQRRKEESDFCFLWSLSKVPL